MILHGSREILSSFVVRLYIWCSKCLHLCRVCHHLCGICRYYLLWRHLPICDLLDLQLCSHLSNLDFLRSHHSCLLDLGMKILGLFRPTDIGGAIQARPMSDAAFCTGVITKKSGVFIVLCTATLALKILLNYTCLVPPDSYLSYPLQQQLSPGLPLPKCGSYLLGGSCPIMPPSVCPNHAPILLLQKGSNNRHF
jgi:hypothetical protein